MFPCVTDAKLVIYFKTYDTIMQAIITFFFKNHGVKRNCHDVKREL